MYFVKWEFNLARENKKSGATGFCLTFVISSNMAAPVLIILGVGILLRFSLFGTPIAEWFAGRNEVTTPLTSWNRGLTPFSLSYRSNPTTYKSPVQHRPQMAQGVPNWV